MKVYFFFELRHRNSSKAKAARAVHLVLCLLSKATIGIMILFFYYIIKLVSIFSCLVGNTAYSKAGGTSARCTVLCWLDPFTLR